MNAKDISRFAVTAVAAAGIALVGTGLAQAGTTVKGKMPMGQCVAAAQILAEQNNPDYSYGPGEDIPIYAGYSYTYKCAPASTIGDAYLIEQVLG